MPRAVSLVLAALLVGLPWMTWFPWWGYRIAGEAAREVPLYLFTAFGLVALGLWLISMDRYLGLFVAFMAVRSIVTPSPLGLAVAHWVALAACVLIVVARWPESYRRILLTLLIISGTLESIYIVMQAWGLDPLWSQTGWVMAKAGVHGTLDHPTLSAAMLAVLTPLAPAWLLPVFAVGLFFTHSLLATVAAIVGVAYRYRREIGAWWLGAGCVTALGVTAYLFRLKSHDSYHERVYAWSASLVVMDHNWPAMLFGFGPGAWYRLVPRQMLDGKPGLTEVFYQAHNEYLQLLFEGGLVAMGLLFLWVLSHRQSLVASPGVIALGVVCLATFPFHIAPSAMTGVAVLALAVAGDFEPLPMPTRRVWTEPPSPKAASWKYWM